MEDYSINLTSDEAHVLRWAIEAAKDHAPIGCGTWETLEVLLGKIYNTLGGAPPPNLSKPE